MWNNQEKTGGSQHQLGKVTGQSGNAILVQSDNDYKSLRMAAPYGITWLPPKYAVAVVLLVLVILINALSGFLAKKLTSSQEV